jgi:hypothetical protein
MLVLRTVVVIVVVVVGVWIYYRLRQNPHPPAPGPAKAVVPGTEKPKAVGSPEPGFLLKHAKDLGLSKEQVARLKKDAAAFDRTTAPLRKQLDAAGKAVAAELNKLTSEKVKMPDVEERTKLYRDLSGKLAELRRAAWQEEQKILTPEQRKKAVEEWAKVHQLFGGKPEAGRPQAPERKSPGGGG